jgi:hypothetical protein
LPGVPALRSSACEPFDSRLTEIEPFLMSRAEIVPSLMSLLVMSDAAVALPPPTASAVTTHAARVLRKVPSPDFDERERSN